MLRFCLFVLLLTSMPFGVQAAQVRGIISDEAGLPMEYVNVAVKGRNTGAVTDRKGYYSIELPRGEHTLIFSFVGYNKQEHVVKLRGNETLVLDVKMEPAAEQLSSFTVASDYKDFAREIARKARAYRKDQQERLKNYSLHSYQRSSLDREFRKKEKEGDSLQNEVPGDSIIYIRETQYLVECVSDFYFDPPARHREDVWAYKDHSETKAKDLFREKSVGFSVEYGESAITPSQYVAANPYVLLKDEALYAFDVYENLIAVPAICSKQLLSPLASTAPVNYSYDYAGERVDAKGRKQYAISVKALFPGEALFEGMLYIADSSFALVRCDLSINPRVLNFCESFSLSILYDEVVPGFYLPVERTFTYLIREGKSKIYGNQFARHNEHQVNIDFPDQFFTSEIKRYKDEAYDRDSLYWSENRKVKLSEKEEQFEHRMDSLRDYHHSEEYLEKLDSNFNKINIWSFLVNGVGHRNRAKGREFMINPLVMQMVPFGIGGYRHRLGGYYNQQLDNGYLLETEGDIDYGFKNRDVKGKVGVGLTYNPKRFTRTFIRVGDYYDMINNYASVSTFFSRSNYARNKTFSIAQRMEIVNGLYGELTYEFSDQEPITGLKMDSWSQDVFDSLNAPTAFTRYIKSEVKLHLTYRFRQPYVIKGGRKIVYASAYPELNLIYRKGIPGMFGSEVNFDYIELGARHEKKIARLGDLKWNIQAGSFFNRSNLRLLEYKYFRGSDPFVFSDPLKSFQLLGPTLSTATAYLRANIIHHFDGVLLSKIPVINWFKISLAAGGGTLLIPEEDFAHIEIFGGVERVFRIRKQLIRMGAYVVTADNTLETADLNLKFGISFFNPFSSKFDY